MARVLVATVIAMLISILAGPKFIAFLRRRELGQQIRAEGPAGHVVKQGTPTMGGILIVFAASLAFLALSRAGRWKLLFLGVISLIVAYLARDVGLSTDVLLPVLGWELPLSWAWYALLFFVIAGAANGVNLTDGIDGLAAGTGIIALFTFTAICVLTSVRIGQLPGGEPSIPYLDMAILGGALIGASIGFLWYNAFPAEVFMGDTGSMAIGGALGTF